MDYVSGNVYWVDSGYKRIEVARADGTHRMELIKNGQGVKIKNPRGIAIDPFGA